MTCDGTHVTRDTRVGLFAGGCPRGRLGSWAHCLVLSAGGCPRGRLGSWARCLVLSAGSCPHGWLGSWDHCLVLSLACPSTNPVVDNR
jgi:hypothetical protein